MTNELLQAIEGREFLRDLRASILPKWSGYSSGGCTTAIDRIIRESSHRSPP